MIVVNKETNPITDVGILLGRQGENEARAIVFDLSWLINEYGAGTGILVHQRSKDTAPYLCTVVQNDNTLSWTLNNNDTAYDGWGQAELRWTVNNVLAKTLVYKTMVVRSITAGEEIPDPYESWYDQMLEQIGDNQEYAEAAAQSASDASGYAQDAEAAKQAVLSANVQITATGNGTVTIGGQLNGE